jgi:hypothetical protein
MAQINSVDLGIIKSEESSKESNLFFFPMPYSDSQDAFLIDLMGTSRTITISGELHGTKSEIQTKIQNIEAIQNGQQEIVTYQGELIEKSVQIQTFSWTYASGDVNRVIYNLTLLEGAN